MIWYVYIACFVTCILLVLLCVYCMFCHAYIACFVLCLLHVLLCVYCMFHYMYITCFVMCILHLLLRVFCIFCYVYIAFIFFVPNIWNESEEFCKFVFLLFHLVFLLSSRVSCGYSSHFLLPIVPWLLVLQVLLRNFAVLIPLTISNTNHYIYTD